MKGGRIYFKSSSEEWATPQDFFDGLEREFGRFDLDPCATIENAKCPMFFTKIDDGLLQDWSGKVFCNPPYGRSIGKWLRKAREEARRCDVIVCLVPAKTDTGWWHEEVVDKAEIRFVRGRLKFGGCPWNAPFGNAVLIYRRSPDLSTRSKDAGKAEKGE